MVGALRSSGSRLGARAPVVGGHAHGAVPPLKLLLCFLACKCALGCGRAPHRTAFIPAGEQVVQCSLQPLQLWSQILSMCHAWRLAVLFVSPTASAGHPLVAVLPFALGSHSVHAFQNSAMRVCLGRECTLYCGGWVAANGWLLIAGEMRLDALRGSNVRQVGGWSCFRCMVLLLECSEIR
jgi:hypothetical protein